MTSSEVKTALEAFVPGHQLFQKCIITTTLEISLYLAVPVNTKDIVTFIAVLVVALLSNQRINCCIRK